MYQRTESDRPVVRFTFEGDPVEARAGESIAAALLAAGVTTFRETPVTGARRGPWCMMGVCFDCLVSIDGRANRQACMVLVADGMAVRRQRGPAAIFDSGHA